MPQTCILCTKKDKKHKGSKQKLVTVETDKLEETIKGYARCLDDQKLLSKLGSFVAKEIRYHSICRTKCQTASEQASKKRKGKEKCNHLSRGINQKKPLSSHLDASLY